MVLSIWLASYFGIIYFIYNEMIFDSYVYTLLKSLSQFILLASFLLSGFIGVLAALASNRMAGPIYRFEKAMDKLSEGDLSINVTVRSHDEFQDTAIKFNNAIQQIREKTQNDQDWILLIQERAKEFSKNSQSDNMSAYLKSLEEFFAQIKNPPFQLKTRPSQND